MNTKMGFDFLLGEKNQVEQLQQQQQQQISSMKNSNENTPVTNEITCSADQSPGYSPNTNYRVDSPLNVHHVQPNTASTMTFVQPSHVQRAYYNAYPHAPQYVYHSMHSPVLQAIPQQAPSTPPPIPPTTTHNGAFLAPSPQYLNYYSPSTSVSSGSGSPIVASIVSIIPASPRNGGAVVYNEQPILIDPSRLQDSPLLSPMIKYQQHHLQSTGLTPQLSSLSATESHSPLPTFYLLNNNNNEDSHLNNGNITTPPQPTTNNAPQSNKKTKKLKKLKPPQNTPTTKILHQP
ncbi:hypothetical protein DLAC_01506 [Tieghemostelium lacteum]|uniref:Uncharacterized protein n=1 Tax=Tieghemostelium lacteum TaxID=361077 RepID=A0A152A622_TIELA|nr:hypothetical protein DLAC_01506 [Tieghemostelium lacteum]|eukprot:KYR01517.1 hypothetical protein DLAC_01506 [Tieghemostelium lacteum]